jgi:hypothetical protein
MLGYEGRGQSLEGMLGWGEKRIFYRGIVGLLIALKNQSLYNYNPKR